MNEEPLIGEWKGILSLRTLCERVQLWEQTALSTSDSLLHTQALTLQSHLLPLLQRRAFLSLWTREHEFKLWDFAEVPLVDTFSWPEMGLGLYSSPSFSIVTTSVGHHTSLGALEVGSVEIRALGPQNRPLNDYKGFGIYRQKGEVITDSWTAVAAVPEIWLETRADVQPSSCRFHLRFLGCGPKPSLCFVFYVKAMMAHISPEVYFPKSLRRYMGTSQKVVFNEHVVIHSSFPHMELIPLAGDENFWGCDYLLAYEIPLDGSFVVEIENHLFHSLHSIHKLPEESVSGCVSFTSDCASLPHSRFFR